MNCEELFYKETDFHLMSFWSDKTQSDFEYTLQELWESKLKKDNVFRYKLNITQVKVLPGKYKFVLKLNPDRMTNRRAPAELTTLNQPFDHEGFNFTKIKQEEILFQINKASQQMKDDLVIINISPLDNYHSMFLPQVSRCQTQIVTFDSLCKVIEIMYLTCSAAFRIGFNSLCGFASLNHLHYHFYYLQTQMLLETISVKHLHGACYVLMDYPARGFVFQISSIQDYAQQLKPAFLLIDHFQKNDVPHNVYITRGTCLDEQGCNSEVTNNMRDVIRVYVWARKSSVGLKRVLFDIKPAICELFGHIIVKSQEEFDSLTEDAISNMLRNLTSEMFENVYDSVLQLFQENQ